MDEARRELGNINRQSNTMADELGELIKKVEEKDQQKFNRERHSLVRDLNILKGKLKGMAANYEPDPDAADPTDPNVTGKPRGQEKGGPKESDEERQEREQKLLGEEQVKATQLENKVRGDEGKNLALATDQEKKNQPKPDDTKPWERQSDPANPVNQDRANEFDPKDKDIVAHNLKDDGSQQPGASGQQNVSTADPTGNPFHQK